MATPNNSSSQNRGSAASSRSSSGLLSATSTPKKAQKVFKFGQNLQSSQPLDESTPFTFRSLHNVSPQPPRTFSKPTRAESTSVTSQSHPNSGIAPDNRSIQGTQAELETLVADISLGSSSSITNAGTGSSHPVDQRKTEPTRPEPQLATQSTTSTEVDNSKLPYDIRDEPVPNEPFYSPVFQSSLKTGEEIAREATDMLTEICSSNGNQALEHLEKLAKDLSTNRGSETRTIAVLGDSGEGKSSLINSLLHYPEIARTGDTGSACTSVVTEYRQKSAIHTSPITVEVEHLDQAGINELLKELCWSYRQLFLPDVESDEVPAEDYQRYQRESDIAWSTLEAAFKHKRGFKQEFLRDMSDGATERITEQLIQWTEDLEWPSGDEYTDGVWRSTAQTAEECCEKTAEFMLDRLWPFTKLIRVYLSSQVLKTGIVLADLPGLQDTNLARVKATQDYLLGCDHIFLVAKISRAITDQSLKSSLYHVLSKHVPMEWEASAGRYLNVAVICTKSEEINETTARREFCGPNKLIGLDVIEDIERRIQAAKRSSDRKLKKRLQLRRQFLFVEARNTQVKTGLQSAYATKVPNGKLEVFCVSNNTYEKYSRKGNLDLVKASGIPDLRSFCYTVTAQSQLLQAKHFLNTLLGSFLNSMQIWVDKVNSDQRDSGTSTVDLKRSLSGYFKTLTSEVIKEFCNAQDNFKQSFKDQVLTYTDNRGEHWDEAAVRKGAEWFSWHWTQYNAWCRNNGDHETAGRSRVNWNQELIWKMRSELDYAWEMVEEEVPEVFDGLLQTLERLLEKLKTSITAIGHSSRLEQSIDLQIQQIAYIVGLSKEEFSRKLRRIRRRAMEGNTGSYILDEMIDSYRSASLESGTGKAARQRATVQGRIKEGTLFLNISVSMQEHVEDLTTATMAQLQEKVLNSVGLLNLDANTSFAQYTVSEVDQTKRQENERAQAKLKDFVEGAKEKHEKILNDISTIS